MQANRMASPYRTTVSADAHTGLRRWRGIILVLIFACLLLSGCTQSEYEQAIAVSNTATSGTHLVDLASLPDELQGLSFSEALLSAGYEQSGSAQLYREADVLRFLGDYVINIPPGAEFLILKELYSAFSENQRQEQPNNAASTVVTDFRDRVLSAAFSASSEVRDDYFDQLHSKRDDAEDDETSRSTELGVLQATFFESFEKCGRSSPWPEVELFVMGDGHAGDYFPDLIERDSDISAFEYRELLHVCGRYAATYPTLDPVVRDELLAPQRGVYARVILNLLDNLQPIVEIPPGYQDEIDELRVNGW